MERKLHRTKDLKKKGIKLISEGKKLQVGTSRTKNTDQWSVVMDGSRSISQKPNTLKVILYAILGWKAGNISFINSSPLKSMFQYIIGHCSIYYILKLHLVKNLNIMAY